jgi:hypothetical protein
MAGIRTGQVEDLGSEDDRPGTDAATSEESLGSHRSLEEVANPVLGCGREDFRGMKPGGNLSPSGAGREPTKSDQGDPNTATHDGNLDRSLVPAKSS